MIDFLAKLLGYIMQGCYWLTNNYVLSLLLFALAMQLLMSPLGIKQQKNMVKQASLRPREMAIRKKYAGRTDKVSMQKCQNEIMELNQKEGYSAVAGCLPMLVQLIIVFPLYQVVIRPLEFLSRLTSDVCGEMASFFEIATNQTGYQINLIRRIQETGVENLPEKFQGFLDGVILPDVSLFGVDLGITPFDALKTASWWLLFVPILNLGFMYLSQFLTKKLSYQNPQADAMNNSSMKIMMYVLPLMTMFITFSFASAIGIYWIFRTILSIAQQFIFAKVMPYPTFTEQDYKNAEREYRRGIKNTSSASANVAYPPRAYRSLHHIDDDEPEEKLPPVKSSNKNKNSSSKSGKSKAAAPKAKNTLPKNSNGGVTELTEKNDTEPEKSSKTSKNEATDTNVTNNSITDNSITDGQLPKEEQENEI